MTEKIILIAIFLFPFQSMGLRIRGSRYDITAFILISLVVCLGFLSGKLRIKKSYTLGIFIFFIYQVAVFSLMTIPPLPRFLSGMLWFGGLLVIVAFSNSIRFRYEQKNLFKIIIVTLSISIVYVLLQKFAFGAVRPKAWFDEPSFAGLAFSGMSAASLCSLLSDFKISVSQKLVFVLSFIISSYCTYLTLSAHVFTLIIAVAMFLISRNFGRISVFLRKGLLLLPIVIPAFISVVTYLLSNEHYSSRLDFATSSSLSTLSWLRGLDQVVASIVLSPIGVGLGGTGHFEYFSENTVKLANLGIRNLNYNDAYSLLFRMIIEMGLPFVVFCMFLFCRKLLLFHKFLNTKLIHQQSETQQTLYTTFNFVFSTTLIIGCLVKEPLYPHSILYTGILIFSSTAIKYAVK
jgi:hypothetical protein